MAFATYRVGGNCIYWLTRALTDSLPMDEVTPGRVSGQMCRPSAAEIGSFVRGSRSIAPSGAQIKVMEAKAKAAYAVAKEKCDDKACNDKAICVKEAKAAQTKALADAKMGK